jgi:hypothetical protein
LLSTMWPLAICFSAVPPRNTLHAQLQR